MPLARGIKMLQVVRREGCPRLRFAKSHRLRAPSARSGRQHAERHVAPSRVRIPHGIPKKAKSPNRGFASAEKVVRREGFEPPTY